MTLRPLGRVRKRKIIVYKHVDDAISPIHKFFSLTALVDVILLVECTRWRLLSDVSLIERWTREQLKDEYMDELIISLMDRGTRMK